MGDEQELWARAFSRLEMPVLESIDFANDGCWLWLGAIDQDGYASRYTHRMHRAIYETLIGPIAEGLVTDHLCRVRRCVNPNHIEPVSNRVNVLRGTGISAANARKGHCKNGHEFTPENTYVYTRKGRPPERACAECRRENVRRYRARKKGIKMGDIGNPIRRREYEPLPKTEPVKEPAAPEPTKEPEKVPA